ncbi:hypothetical protein T439DRAFT_72391 [Meredithblackwellia eburnea MCA 4105]
MSSRFNSRDLRAVNAYDATSRVQADPSLSDEEAMSNVFYLPDKRGEGSNKSGRATNSSRIRKSARVGHTFQLPIRQSRLQQALHTVGNFDHENRSGVSSSHLHQTVKIHHLSMAEHLWSIVDPIAEGPAEDAPSEEKDRFKQESCRISAVHIDDLTSDWGSIVNTQDGVKELAARALRDSLLPHLFTETNSSAWTLRLDTSIGPSSAVLDSEQHEKCWENTEQMTSFLVSGLSCFLDKWLQWASLPAQRENHAHLATVRWSLRQAFQSWHRFLHKTELFEDAHILQGYNLSDIHKGTSAAIEDMIRATEPSDDPFKLHKLIHKISMTGYTESSILLVRNALKAGCDGKTMERYINNPDNEPDLESWSIPERKALWEEAKELRGELVPFLDAVFHHSEGSRLVALIEKICAKRGQLEMDEYTRKRYYTGTWMLPAVLDEYGHSKKE